MVEDLLYSSTLLLLTYSLILIPLDWIKRINKELFLQCKIFKAKLTLKRNICWTKLSCKRPSNTLYRFKGTRIAPNLGAKWVTFRIWATIARSSSSCGSIIHIQTLRLGNSVNILYSFQKGILIKLDPKTMQNSTPLRAGPSRFVVILF
jgi:hypothetical protein